MCNYVYFIKIGACFILIFLAIRYRVVFYAVFYIEMIVTLSHVLK